MEITGRAWTASAVLVSLFMLTSCSRGNDEQAVRHAVTAELIERYQVSEDRVRLVDIRDASCAWLVRAEISSGARSGAKRQLTCRVERFESSTPGQSRWTLTTIEDREIGENPKQ